jgi:hypothetical protein
MVYDVVFSRDDKRIITASPDGALRLWDAPSGTQIGEPIHNASGKIAVNRDGNRIATVSGGTAQLWAIFATPQSFVLHVKAVITRCLTTAQRKAFFLPPEPPLWCIEREKWPYRAPAWKQWLADTRAGKNPPLPSAP